MKKSTALFLLVALTGASSPAIAQVTTPESLALQAAQTGVKLFQSRNYVTPNTTDQHFEDNINLRPNQDQRPLILEVTNGPENKTKFNWFRLNIAGYLMATEKDLNGQRTAALDVSGKIQPGGGQVIVEAAGEPGASLNFSLSTKPVILSSINPPSMLAGTSFVLVGKNFSSDEEQDQVLVNGKPCEILSASKRSITAMAPSGIAGTGRVKVVVDSIESRELPIAIGTRAMPVLTGSNYWMAPPGAELTINGQNFSANAGENKVYFGNVPAQVVSADGQTLNVIIPNWNYGGSQINIPITVVSEGVRSSNTLPFDIGPKYLGATPPIPGDSYN